MATCELILGKGGDFKAWESIDLMLTNIYEIPIILKAIHRYTIKTIIHNHRNEVFKNSVELGEVFPRDTNFKNQKLTGLYVKKKELDLSDLDMEGPFWPLEFPLRILKAYAKPGWTILDPFMGRGTCGKAALQLGMNFIGIDQRPERVRIAKEFLNV